MLAEQIAGLVRRMVGPLKQRVDAMILRTVVDAISDGSGFQVVKCSSLDDLLDRVEHLQPGGVSHVATSGAEGLLLGVGGRKNHPVAILVSNRAGRPKNLAPGETGLWTAVAGPDGGLRLHLKANGEVWAGSQDPDTMDPVSLSTPTDDFIARLDGILRTGGEWTPVPNDGGAALQAAYTSEFPTPPASTAATKLKAD